MSQLNRDTVTMLKRNVSADESAPHDTQSLEGAGMKAQTSTPPADDRNEFREGFMHGRSQSIRDSEQLANYFGRRDRAAATRGLALGLLLASVVGGAIAALAYFELRLDSLTPRETPIQLIPQPERNAPEPEAPAREQAPIQLPFDRGSTPQEDISPEEPPSETIPAPETSERSSFSFDLPLGLPPMGGPYDAEETPQDAPVASPPETDAAEATLSIKPEAAAIA